MSSPFTGGSARNSARPRIASTTVELPPDAVLAVAGPADENLRVVEDSIDVDILTRGNHIVMRGEAALVSQARRVLQELISMVDRGHTVDPDTTRRIIAMVEQAAVPVSVGSASEPIVSYRGKAVRPKTPGQKEYVEAIDDNSVVFGVGPAGTGKTYLAMAKAVQALQSKQVSRIILTRPAVEAGEKLGFLPGTTRLTRSCAPCTMRFARWWIRRPFRASWRPAWLRLPRWRTCVAGRSTIPS